jgi:hypothetical protein
MKFVSSCSRTGASRSKWGTKDPHVDRQGHLMLLITLAFVAFAAIAWLIAMVAIVGMCRQAAQGDHALAGPAPVERRRLVA